MNFKKVFDDIDNALGVFSSPDFHAPDAEDASAAVIIMPSLYEICKKKNIERDVIFENTKIKLIDVRDFINGLPGSVAYLDMLYSEDNYLAPSSDFRSLIDLRDKIARADEKAFLVNLKKEFRWSCTNFELSMAGSGKYSKEHFFEVYHFMKMVERYTSGKPYSEVIAVKKSSVDMPEHREAMEIRTDWIDRTIDLIDDYDPAPVDEETLEKMDVILERIVGAEITEAMYKGGAQ